MKQIKYLTVIDKNNELVLSIIGTIDLSEIPIINDDYTLIASDVEPLFTSVRFGDGRLEETIKYYPDQQYPEDDDEG